MEQRKSKNLVESYINGELKHERLVPILSYKDREFDLELDILTPESITILFGPTGCGKSKIAAHLVRQLLLKNPDKNFQRLENKKKYRVIVVETEMSDSAVMEYYMQNNFSEYDSFYEAYKDMEHKERYNIYPVSSHSIDESNNDLRLIAREEEKYLNDYNIIVFVDNLGSFTEDLNSSSNNGWMKNFKAIFSKFSVLAVMHSNFKESSNNKGSATGSLGSSAEKIAQNVLQVTRYDEGATIRLKKSKTQNDRKRIELSFLFNEIGNKSIVSMSKVPFAKKQNEDESKSRRITLSNRILNHLNGKPVDSDERLKKNLVNAFPDLYKEKMMYQIIKEFENDKILYQRNDFLFHNDEANK